jgi:hypothetical protein
MVQPFVVVGSVSVKLTPVAFPVPMFETVTTNPAVLPAEIGEASAVFVTLTSGQFTEMTTAPDEGLPSFVDVTVTVFETVPHVAEVVGEEIWTDREAPPPASETPLTPPQERTPEEIVQVPPQPADGLSELQFNPVFVGSVSDSLTAVAVPAPEFVTVMVYPIGEPAETEAASRVFVTDRFGQLTVIKTGPAEPEGWLVEANEAVLDTVPHVADVVGEVIWTVVVPPDAIDVEGHVKVPDAIVQAADQPVWVAIAQVSPPLDGRVSESVTPVAVPGPALETVIT